MTHAMAAFSTALLLVFSATYIASQAAESAAITNLNEVNADCLSGTLTLVYDTQQSSGTWAAEVSAKCLTPGS